MTKKYVKRPIPVSAFKWDGELNTIRCNVPPKDFDDRTFNWGTSPKGVWLQIQTLEGAENCPVGDMIIRGVNGEYYPCDPEIFKETYRPATSKDEPVGGETLNGAYRRGFKDGRKKGMLEVGKWLRRAGLNLDTAKKGSRSKH